MRVLDEKDSDADLQATLFDLAERGVLRLRGDDDTWYVEVVQPLEAEHLHPLEQSLLAGLGLDSVGDVFVVSSTETSGRKVATARASLRAQVAVGCLGLPAVLTCGHRGSRRSAGSAWPPRCSWSAATSSTTAGCGGRFWSGPRRSRWWPPEPCSDAGVTTVRTAEGRDLWSRTGGFARFLTTDSSESRFDASAHMDWYPRYLAWAVALGIGRRVGGRRYEAQGVDGARRALDRVDGRRYHGSAPDR